MKTFSHIVTEKLTDVINKSINEGKFPSELKLADVIPCFKKDDPTNKSNYRPISILSAVSKVYEKVIYNQIFSFIEPMLNKLLCGFRKRHSSVHAIFRLLKDWQNCIDNSGIVGTLLMDLSKAYDCIPHDLLIAKLEAYGFHFKSLNLIFSYLSNRKQRTKIGSVFSEWLEVVLGVPQGSILGPLLFNIFINDLLLFIKETDICNFADDNTLYACDVSLENVIRRLQNELINTNKWLENNSMIANPSKFQLMFLGLNRQIHYESLSLNYMGKKITASREVKLLGLTIDMELKFSSHIRNICFSANNSLYAFKRVRNYLTFSNAKIMFNSFILSRFLYCSIIWMFCSKKSTNTINSIHKRALRILHRKPNISLTDLLKIDHSPNIHLIHLRSLMIEVFKSVNKINPEFMWDYFTIKLCPYNLRKPNLLCLPTKSGKSYGTKTLVYKATSIWNTLDKSILSLSDLRTFIRDIKKWNGERCICHLCKT